MNVGEEHYVSKSCMKESDGAAKVVYCAVAKQVMGASDADVIDVDVGEGEK